MKHTFFILIVLYACMGFAQKKPLKKPEYVIVTTDSIISKKTLETFAKEKRIKIMNKGVSEKEHLALKKKYGNTIGDKEFIITITLYTKAEQKAREATKPNLKKEAADKSPTTTIKINDVAKDFTVQMIDSTTLSLSGLKGKVVLINFWATWCGPCLMEFYEFPSQIIAPFKDEAFVLLPISRGETLQKVQGKMKQLNTKGIAFNVGIDPNQNIARLFDAQNIIPKNIIIDKNGIIRYISNGNAEGNVSALATEIQQLLNE